LFFHEKLSFTQASLTSRRKALQVEVRPGSLGKMLFIYQKKSQVRIPSAGTGELAEDSTGSLLPQERCLALIDKIV
jgi:hypothetical protein